MIIFRSHAFNDKNNKFEYIMIKLSSSLYQFICVFVLKISIGISSLEFSSLYICLFVVLNTCYRKKKKRKMCSMNVARFLWSVCSVFILCGQH